MMIARGFVVAAIVVVVGLIGGIVTLGVMAARDDTVVANPTRMLQMEGSGEMHRMLQQHRDMLDRMAFDASSQMLEVMENDPMTQMMRSGEMMRMLAEHKTEMGRMLGR